MTLIAIVILAYSIVAFFAAGHLYRVRQERDDLAAKLEQINADHRNAMRFSQHDPTGHIMRMWLKTMVHTTNVILDRRTGRQHDDEQCIAVVAELVSRVRGNRPDSQPWNQQDNDMLYEASLQWAAEALGRVPAIANQ